MRIGEVRMVQVNITYDADEPRMRRLRFSIREKDDISPIEFQVSFKQKDWRAIETFITGMDNISDRAATLRRAGKLSELSRVNGSARTRVEKFGKKFFKLLPQNFEGYGKTFDTVFGKEFQLSLGLDGFTRRIPWELIFDKAFGWTLAIHYAVGRIVAIPNTERADVKGLRPKKRALIVGLDYNWDPDESHHLYGTLGEVAWVEKRLKQLGYVPKVLFNEEADLENVTKWLRSGVRIFHFTGHGGCSKKADEGFHGLLELYKDDPEDPSGFYLDLTEGWLTDCFNDAGRSPWFVFLNACQTAKEIHSSHMVEEFIAYGATHIIGTLWSVRDEPASDFAKAFYDNVLADKKRSIGEALRMTRYRFSRKKENAEAVTWPAFILYGNPETPFKRAPQ